MCPSPLDPSSADTTPYFLRVLLSTANQHTSRVFLRVGIRQFQTAPTPKAQANQTMHMTHSLERGGSSEVSLDLYCTDGSPYWTHAEKNESRAKLAGDKSYQESLSHLSASHSPSLDRSFQGTPAPAPDSDAYKLNGFDQSARDLTPAQRYGSVPPGVSRPYCNSPDHLLVEPRPGSRSGDGTHLSTPSLAHRLQHSLSDDPLVAHSHTKIRRLTPMSGVGFSHGATDTSDPALFLYGGRPLLPSIESA